MMRGPLGRGAPMACPRPPWPKQQSRRTADDPRTKTPRSVFVWSVFSFSCYYCYLFYVFILFFSFLFKFMFLNIRPWRMSSLVFNSQMRFCDTRAKKQRSWCIRVLIQKIFQTGDRSEDRDRTSISEHYLIISLFLSLQLISSYPFRRAR